MRIILLIILTLVGSAKLTAQNKPATKPNGVIMTIRGFNYLKADSITNGANLNNPEILDTIVSYLFSEPTAKIALHYHGSCKLSSSSYWNHHTQNQADGCMGYIISKGINSNRITAIGKGFTDLINDCHCRDCSEGEFEKNHRLEVVKLE